uniref:Uncharacterized protein AlNc14C1224G12840 n=1 Tax=Albugo laibachii Nc14 TaxID=890382 RepID=F0X2K9_9STRA|nr:hypothetical protein SS1G_12417 [Albugo laibachii Nc14]|eukprot:CCA28121.1 hypothetical protein SS1G_12417 [Albugo laibachii Nc14]
MRNNKVMAMVTLDVQGAFDAVLHEQGWPKILCQWVESFLTTRRIRVRHHDGTTRDKVLECGVPQGSPLSPLLFLLYIAVLVQDEGKNNRFGYADDISILVVGSTASEAVAAAQEEVNKLVHLANENMIDFDPAKSELLVIGGGPKKKLDTSGLSIQVGGHSINPSPCVRWLGVWIDSQLNFKQHVQEWCGKAQRVTQFIRQINTVQRGAAPGLMIKAVQACVLSTALYGAEAWWPGTSRITTKKDKKVGTGVGWHTNLLDSTITKAIRAALPVWRTTPNLVLHRESGIPPATILLQQKQLLAAARIQRLDAWHPLVFRARESPKETISRLKLRAGQKDRAFTVPERYLTRLQISARSIPTAEGHGHLFFPRGEPKIQSTGDDKQDEKALVKQWMSSLPSDTVLAYSDGSSCGPARSAWGYVLYKEGQLIGQGAGAMPGAEVYDAEILGAQKALEAAILKAGNSPIKVLLDNSAVVRALQRGRSKSSQAIVDKYIAQTRVHPAVETRWIPGHTGITGNEAADKLAKAALKELPPETSTESPETRSGHRYTFAAVSRFVKERCEKAVESWWLEIRPSRYADLELMMKRSRPPELRLPRWAYHRLIAARTGHGNFKGYHERFGHENIDCSCVCGRERRPWHFAECRLALQNWRNVKRVRPPGGREMLAENGWEDFYRYVTVSGCYNEVFVSRGG